MGISAFLQKGIFSRMVIKLWKWDAREKVRRLSPWLKINQKVLDVGSGYGMVAQLLQQMSIQVDCLDIADSAVEGCPRPMIFDGYNIPEKISGYDYALLLTVLHHSGEPERLLNACSCISKGVIVIEDVYSNNLQRRLTHFFDSLLNWEFKDHPHSNKTHQEWLKTFRELNLELVGYHSKRFVGLFRQNTYVLRSGIS
jgi:2-polyprenyl-3-methyl-5-hydroxy-6-metoxy-1,4-benzoquinol methylase